MKEPIRTARDYDGNLYKVFNEGETVHLLGCSYHNIPTNPNYREYSVRIPLTEHKYCKWEKLGGYSSCYSSDPHHQHVQLFEIIGKIDGITDLLLSNAYTVGVSIADCFDWDEIDEKLIPILQSFSGITEQKLYESET